MNNIYLYILLLIILLLSTQSEKFIIDGTIKKNNDDTIIINNPILVINTNDPNIKQIDIDIYPISDLIEIKEEPLPEPIFDLSNYYKKDINEHISMTTRTHMKFDKDLNINIDENENKTIMEIYDDLVHDGRFELGKSKNIDPYTNDDFYDLNDNNAYGYTDFSTYKKNSIKI